MSRIITFLTAVSAKIAEIPDVKEAGYQLGRFDLDSLARVGRRAPFVTVGVLSAPVSRGADTSPSALCEVAAFVVTDGVKDRREAQAWGIGEQIAVLASAQAQMWGLVGLGTPEKVRIQPQTSATANDKGTCLLAVTWQQKLLRIGEGFPQIEDTTAEPAPLPEGAAQESWTEGYEPVNHEPMYPPAEDPDAGS